VQDQENDPNSLLNFTRKLIRTVKTHMAFGEGDFTWADCPNAAVAAYFRTYTGFPVSERLLIVQNLSDKPQDGQIKLPGDASSRLTDLLSDQTFQASDAGILNVKIEPFAYFWLQF